MARGAGSISSPIIISDDEDEAFVESQLTDLPAAGDPQRVPSTTVVSHCEGLPSTRDLQPSSTVPKTVGYSMALRMGFRPGRGLGPQLDGRVDPLSPSSLGLKRKRNDSGIGFQSRPSNNTDDVREERKKQRQDQLSSKVKLTNTAFPLPKKPPQIKAQKGSAKGKGKRAAVGLQPQGKSSVPVKGKVPLSPSQLSCTPGSLQVSTNQVPSTSAVPPGRHAPHQPQAQQFNDTISPFHNTIPFPVPDLPELWQMQYWLGSAPPYLPWQELTNSLPGDHLNPPNHAPPSSYAQDPPLDAGRSSSNDASGSYVGPTEVQVPGVSVSKAIPMKRPKNCPSIGRGPEADPQSTHGTYTKTHFFQPNPACTIVLDSIPPRYRTVPWVTGWAVNAGQVQPVQVDLDTKRGKGLIEFPDASAARKAFNSKQLRGKGRQTIRAWWYRVVGVGSKSGVGEIEEGEIEDTTTGRDGKDVLPLTRKQKKKFRVQTVATGPGLANGGDTSTPTCDPDPGGTSPRPERLQIAAEESGSCTAMQTALEHLNGWDKSSIASSRPPSVRLCATPPPNDMEDMIMSSPLSGHHPPHIEDSLPVPADPVGIPNGPPWDESTSATAVDATPTETKATTVPTVNGSLILQPIPQVVDITPDGSHDLAPAVTIISQLPPSEPRSFRNPPVAPSFTKRFLLARQQELQDKIVQSKLALGLEQNNMKSTPSPSTSTSSSSVRNTPSAADTLGDKVVMEQNLRRLVLESKKNRLTSSCVTPTTPTSDHVPSSTHSTLETLAVSFITESIESAKQSVFKSVPSNTRHELAIKQGKLERYIAESKALIAKLNEASNKEEKENILSAMRECSRMMELDEPSAAGGTAVSKPAAFCWPSSCDMTVLEISDDEDG